MSKHTRPNGSKELRADEATYRAVFDRVADALIVHAKDDHRILDANSTCLKRLGYTLEEMQAMTPQDLHPAEELERIEAKIDVRNPDAPNTYVHVTKSGVHIPVEILSDEIVYKGTPAWLSIARDIRERKAWEEMIAAARDEALEASRLKSNFVASISHELRTPMNGVVGMTSLLLETELDGEQREYAETVQHAANSMLELLNELLDLSKIESGKLEIESVPFDLRHNIEGVYRILQPRALENEVELIFDFDSRIPERLLGDPLRTRQVITNLVGNALKFTQEGHVAIRIADLGRNGSDIVIGVRVEDTGIGIPQTQLQKIFEEFQQADGSTTRRFGGTGLGLTISRRLVQLMGGELRVESVEGRGSVFSFELRLPIYAALLELNPDLVPSHGDALVVHADAMRRELIGAELQRLGLRVFTAPSAGKALALLDGELASNTLVIAVVDYVLPDLDGETFAHSLVRRGALAAGAVVLERPASVRLDPERLRRHGIGALHGLHGDPELAEILKRSARPLSMGPSTPPQQPRRESEASRRPAAKSNSDADLQVLVVEDNPVNQRVISHLLGKLGCGVDVAEHGLRAVEMVQQKQYSIIFMDCQMPELDGYAATGRIRELPHPSCDTPIVALTANAMDGDREKCLRSGMDDYLSKPATSKQIQGMLQKWAGTSTPVQLC